MEQRELRGWYQLFTALDDALTLKRFPLLVLGTRSELTKGQAGDKLRE